MNLKFLYLILIASSLVLSGCLREYDSVVITSVDVMSSPQDEGTKLTVTSYIQNNQNSDTGVLTLNVKVREPSSNLIVASKDADIGYIKARSGSASSVTMTVSNPGDYGVEVQLLESGKILSQNYAPVVVKPKPGPGQPADIKLTSMNLIVTRLVNDATTAEVEVSPGIYNQGGDSKPLTMEVTARVDPYTAYTRSDDLGIVKSTGNVRGKVTFLIPRNREYTFTISVIESGRTVVSSRASEKIKLNEIKFNTPMTYALIEEGKPVATPAATPQEPGFEIMMALIGILLVYGIVNKIRNEKVR